jgi:hypothetical protein
VVAIISVSDFDRLSAQAFALLGALRSVPLTPCVVAAYVAAATRDDLEVRLWFDATTSEWDFTFTCSGEPQPPLSATDLLRVSDCPPGLWQSWKTVMSDDPEAALRLLSAIAATLSRYVFTPATDFAVLFDHAVATRGMRAVEYTRAVQQAPAIETSDAAWKSKDYPGVVQALERWDGQLPLTHDRRLRFARAHLKGDEE